MNFNNKILNNLISKDFKLAKSSCEKLINDNILDAWEELTDKSEFIFDFIKEKINKNLISSVNAGNFDHVLNFMQIYHPDFEDFILKTLLKFANEDLSDKLLGKLENGTNGEKCWATLYFSHILDPLALDIIKENLNSDDENLNYLTIKALKAHGADDLLNEAKEKLHSEDDETAYEGFQFIIAWQDENSIEELLSFIEKSPYKVPLSLDLIYFVGLEDIYSNFGFEKANYVFNLLIEGIPEIIKPDEYILEEISNYTNKILNRPYTADYALSILMAKLKFELINSDDSYTFDLDKNTKNKIKEVSNIFSSIENEKLLELNDALKFNLRAGKYVLETLEIIEEENLLDSSEEIAELIKNSNDSVIVCKCCEVLKEFGKLDLINKEIALKNITTNDAKALIESYFEN